MIPRELEAQILRLHHAEGWPIGTLARQLHLHHSTVRRVLGQAGIPAAHQYTRPLMVEPFVPFIQETLARYPTLRASRLYRMVRERGYPGAPDHFRALVARYRPRQAALDGLRDGAVLLTAALCALLPERHDGQLPRWPCAGLQLLQCRAANAAV